MFDANKFGKESLRKSNFNQEMSYTDDRTLSSGVGYQFNITDKLLGHGSFGQVYIAVNEHNKEIAVKCCTIDEKGIPSILEASIMASMVHPYLNTALCIKVTPKKLYIIQDLALTDLSQYTRRGGLNHSATLQQLKVWAFSLCCAVSILHGENIIHADIKASNILLYPDGTIRLTDYTLATKKWSSDQKFIQSVCTSTHRPPECFLEKHWDESLDIWSIGCTLYEIAYGEFLFKHQGDKSIFDHFGPDPQLANEQKQDQHHKDKAARKRLCVRSINTFIDWDIMTKQQCMINFTRSNISYFRPQLCEEFNKAELTPYNNILLSMLKLEANKRSKLVDILKDTFFQGMVNPDCKSLRRPANKLLAGERGRVMKHINSFTLESNIRDLAFNIYCKCNQLNNIDELVKSAACVWISSKIVLGYPIDVNIKPHLLLNAEREICHNLDFRLHY